MNSRLTILLVALALLFLVSPAHAQTTDPALAGIQPQIDVGITAYKDLSGDAIQSSLASAMQPLNIGNPYGAAGQPVVVEFTLSNIGQEYPYNQIPLSPDVWALVMGVDKDLGVVLCKAKNADGTCTQSDTYDVWSQMSGLQQVYYVTGVGLSQLVETLSSEVSGKTCRYVDIYAGLPADVKKKIIAANDGKPPEAVYTWDCLDIVDEPFFNSRVKSYCKNQITTSCITELNKEVGKHAVRDTLPVILSSKVPKGTCVRPAFEQAKAGDIIGLFGSAVTGNQNIVFCGIGPNGLLPNESVTFRFYVLIPADAPVVPVDELANISEINNGYTTSPSCANSSYPQNCHSIYAAVAPVYPDTLLSDLGKLLNSVPTVIGGAFAAVWNLDADAFANYVLTQQNVAYGQPIWRGQGIFYVLGAQLQGDVYLYLFFAFISSAVVGGAIKKKTGGGIQ